MKRYISIIVIILLILSLLSGCTTKDNKDKQEQSITTIKFATYYSSKDQVGIYQAAAKAYEKLNKNVKVEIQSDFGDEQQVKDALTKESDINLLGIRRDQVIEYAKSGLLTDLSQFANENQLDQKLFKISLAYGKYNGKVYGIGDMPMTIEWFYNPDIFQKYNLSEPKTIADLSKICNTLKANKITPISVGAMDGWTLSTLFGMITAQTTGAEDFTTFYGAGQDAYKKVSGIQNAFKIYGTIVSSLIPKNSIDINYIASIDDFVKGKAAILPAGSWAITAIDQKKPANFNYKIFDSSVNFVANPVTKYSATAGQVIVIPSNNKNSKDAEKFLQFLFSKDVQKLFVDKGYISSLMDANNQESSIEQQIIEHLKATDDNSVMLMDNLEEPIADNLTSVLQDMQEGRVSSSEAWDRVLKNSFKK